MDKYISDKLGPILTAYLLLKNRPDFLDIQYVCLKKKYYPQVSFADFQSISAREQKYFPCPVAEIRVVDPDPEWSRGIYFAF